jgi:chemotaxis protein MotB
MSKVVPVLSILIAGALGGVIYFYVQNQQLSKDLLEANGHVQNLSSSLNELNGEKEGISEENEKNRQKLISSQSEYEKTLAKLLEEQKNNKELQDKRSEIVKNLEDEIADQRVKISQLNGVITVKMENKILFPSGEATISEEGETLLKRVASSFNRIKGKRIRVEGHTDNIPIKNSRFPSNWELSSTRAANVLHVLVNNSKLKPALYELVGMGEFHPVAKNDTAANRALNRRIEIRLLSLNKAD